MFNRLFNQTPMYQPFGALPSAIPKTGFNWGNLLSNTQKVLNIINQAIPVFYQVKPIWNNAKTMFRIMGEMGKINNNRSNNSNTSTNTTTVNNQQNLAKSSIEGPNFFV
ncbi:MAG TPA: hypothetical protein GXZ95_01620 [Mollicutes bacterium]|nr:hypothetical protein [Mollicutes bacterium]